MSEDLTARLRAAIEQRQALAEEASPSPWSANAESDEVVAVDGITVCDGFALSGRQLRATVSHIVANDPKTVLARCRADLAILDEHAPSKVVSYGRSLLVCKTCFGYTREEVEAFFDSAEIDHPAPQLRNVPYPCRTVILLAEGYGITEEET